jgi:hypothetical protein
MIALQNVLGGTLFGDRLVRVIYMDEAGTSANEPVALVVGIVVHADNQWRAARGAVADALSLVPQNVLKGFIYHTTTLLGHKYDGVWEFKDRLAFIHRMMGIPRSLNLGIVIGAAAKAKIPANCNLGNLNLDQFSQAEAFAQCLNAIGQFLRQHGDPNEIGMVIAEDVPKIRASLQRSLRQLKFNQTTIVPSSAMESGQTVEPRPIAVSARRIVGPINFAPKDEDSLLWVADACAFGLKRLFSKWKYGYEWGRSIMGDEIDLEKYVDSFRDFSGWGLLYGARPRDLPAPKIIYSVS